MAAMEPQEDAETAVAVARQWLEAQGWAELEGRTYTLALSELQSCPPGYRCVDVNCTTFVPEDAADEQPDWNGHAELLRRSRMLEIDLGKGAVDAVLAARDQKELKQILELERVEHQSAQMEQELENKIRLRAEAATAEAAEEVAAAAAGAAAALQAAQSTVPTEEDQKAGDADAQEEEEKERRRADEEFELQVQAEIERALADPEAYAAEQAVIEANAAAQLAARQAADSWDSELAAAPAVDLGLPAAAPPSTAEARPPPGGEAPTVHSACETNNVTTLRELLAEFHGSSTECLGSKDRRGWTPLHTAASSGSTECMVELLSRGAKCAATDKDGQTVLHRAVRHPAAVAAVLHHGEDASKTLVAVDKRGCSALQLAAAAGADESCVLLCEAAATGDVKAQALPGKPDKRGQTPLMAGCNGGYQAVVAALLAVGATAKVEHVDANGVSALLLAARRGDRPNICELLLGQGAQVWSRSKAGTTAVAEAAAAPGGEGTVALLMQSAIASTGLGSLPLRDVATAVHAAAAKGHHKAVACLVEPYRSLPPPPPAAAKTSPPPLPKLLLSKFGKAKEVALHAAARAGHTEAVRLILQVAAQYEPKLLSKCIEALTTTGESALVLAVRAGSLDCARALRSAGAAVTLSAVRVAAESDDSATNAPEPLLAELLGGLDDPEALRSCLALPSVDANDGTAAGETPLAAASRAGKSDSVVYILQRATQVLPDGVNVPGLGFDEALRGAVYFNHLQTLEALLQGGAPKAAVLEASDSDGWGLLHVAAFHGGIDILKVLLGHGDDEGHWLDVDRCANFVPFLGQSGV
jgi:ankyrin repeat protein